MAGAEQVVNVWKEWGIQMLVLLSFTLQVTLLILAEFRRRVDSGVLRSFVWSAYMLADATAIYVLGHMSVTRRLPEHELVAFWAPFLLMHLGGQDNITAYAIEDNELWLRHLQTLAVQVAAAGYVLYESSALSSSRSLLRPAIILMFVAGAVKYGERVWALKCASSSSSGLKYRSFEKGSMDYRHRILDKIVSTGRPDAEARLLMAHQMLEVPNTLLKGPLPYAIGFGGHASDLPGDEVYKVIEIQLSLMHDVYYTKSEVMYRWYGLCIRMVSLVATAVAFVLFHLWNNHHRLIDGYSSIDVVVTYVLLVGALVLEIVSVSRAIFSSWTCVLLLYFCGFLGRAIVSLRRLVRAADWRGRHWSGSMGQLNLVRLAARSRASRISKISRWMGVEDWWNTLAYSWSIPVSVSLEEMLVNKIFKDEGASTYRPPPHKLFNTRAPSAISSRRLDKNLAWTVEERILVWHIATNVFLSYWYENHGKHPKAEAIEVVSNYMMFLVAARPFMVSPTASHSVYAETCYSLTALEYKSDKDLASLLQRHGKRLNEGPHFIKKLDFTGDTAAQNSFLTNEMLTIGCKLGATFIEDLQRPRAVSLKIGDAQHPLDSLTNYWVETLFYAALQSTAYAHAKQLSNGGELITVAAFLVQYLKLILYTRK